MTDDSRHIAGPQRQARTRLGNGTSPIANVDGRTHGGRRFRELAADLAHHLGGSPTPPQQAIIQRAAALIIWCEGQETALANGADFDVAAFTTAANSLRRLLADLGLDRRLKDVTPSLEQFLAAKLAEQ
ncbi:hypothetical protein [Sandarakinorhabdus limnophila]|uniref:hypothetical protein n=1 Tax=Sandarakinorhabdus limnophila TaxID=210512 RepID=UPI0026E9FEB2|nr:hypothetical protein [Sandarakinorhabdus limnophila]